MDSLRSTVSGFGAAIIAVALVAITWFILPRIDQYLKITAVNDCGRVSKYEARPDVNTFYNLSFG